ncbi:NAD(P)/FAD-dependent oxidoreductase [Xanthobacter pseudotagetidis]|uniref:NAD(P)/FAD-dependent oxidoreductase n=1 Tax=Xanthobacter pseudotagetidis TaxID=3119911 RepID=UPI003729C4BC
MEPAYDVVIVGGAATGSSVAYHLAADPAFTGRVLVLEQDPSYARAASALSAASIRQQYSTAINVEVSLFGIDFLRAAPELLAVDGERPALSLHEGGYLFLASAEGRSALAAGHAVQRAHGADIAFLEPDALAARFSWLDGSGIAAGCLGLSGEGWFDGWSLFMALRRKARSLGADYRAARAAAVETAGGKVTGVRLHDGTRIPAGVVVNAAGAGGRALAASAGIDIPVHMKKRMIFTFTAEDPPQGLPLVIDPSGAYVRPEGRGFLGGSAPAPEDDPDSDDFEVDHAFFDAVVWPRLAERIPAFERIRPGRAWAGHYDMNAFDQNAFVGPVAGVDGFYLANGFSGHGLQQSPAVGRGLAELIAHRRFRTLDLSPLGFDRLACNAPLRELKVV